MPHLRLLCSVLAAAVLIGGCTPPPPASSGMPVANDASTEATASEAQVLVQRVNDESYARQREQSAAQWTAAT